MRKNLTIADTARKLCEQQGNTGVVNVPIYNEDGGIFAWRTFNCGTKVFGDEDDDNRRKVNISMNSGGVINTKKNSFGMRRRKSRKSRKLRRKSRKSRRKSRKSRKFT